MSATTQPATQMFNSMFSGAMLLGIGAAVVTAGWNYIRVMVFKLWSLVFIEVKIDTGYVSHAVERHLWSSFRPIRLGLRTFDGTSIYVRPVKRVQLIAHELLGNDSTLFFNGWRPLIARFSLGTGNGAATQAQAGISLVFIRGTFNVDLLIQNSVDDHNKFSQGISKKGQQVLTRFRIQRFSGRGSVDSRRSGSSTVTEPHSATPNGQPVSSDALLELSRRRLLRWSINELGPEISSSDALGTLAFPSHVRSIISEVKYWLASEEWYRSKKIPWTRGLLMYGDAGTGKTSLLRALGQDFGLPVFLFDIATMNNEELNSYWDTMLEWVPCIAAIEDLDGVFHKRDNILGRSGGGLTFDCLLNCLSGVQVAGGVFKVITSNHIDQIDEAIGIPKAGSASLMSTRPGRMDIAVKLPSTLDETGRRKIAGRIMSDCPELISGTVAGGADDTPAQFEMRCAELARSEHWKNINTAVADNNDGVIAHLPLPVKVTPSGNASNSDVPRLA